MPEKKARTATKKVKDKWKAKSWYTILAPDMFNRQVIGETLTDDQGKIQGRVTETTVQDLTGDFMKVHIKLEFKVDEIRGKEAHASFHRQDLTSDYIRRLARRKRTRTDASIDVVTKDKYTLRIKPMAITEQRIQSSKQSDIRRVMEEALRNTAGEMLFQDFIRAIISGEVSKNIVHACKKVQIINRVEIRKTEYVSREKVEGLEAPKPEPAAEELPPEAKPEEAAPEAEQEIPEEVIQPETPPKEG